MVRHLAKRGQIAFQRSGEEFLMGIRGMDGSEITQRMDMAATFSSGAGTKRFEMLRQGGNIHRSDSIPGGGFTSGTHGTPGGSTFRGTSGSPAPAGPSTTNTSLTPHAGPQLPRTQSTAMVPWKPKEYQAYPIRSGRSPAPSMSAGFGAAGAVGGMLGAVTADDDQRGRGAIMGAFGGMATGKAFRTFGAHGSGFSDSVYSGINKKVGLNAAWGPMHRGWNKHKSVVHKGLRGFHSSEGRHNMFRSGAMLGGAAFGAMFASNGRSHKRGFNANRGNSFSR